MKLTEELDAAKKLIESDQSKIKINELNLEIQDLTETYEQNKKDLYEQLDQKDATLSETYAQLAESRKEIEKQVEEVDQAENAIREYRAKMSRMDEEN